MLEELRRHRDRAPEAIAVRCAGPDGPVSTSWAELYQDVRAVAAGAASLPGHAPVVVLLDASAAGIATVLGLTGAGRDVLLLEAQSSYLDDPGSPVHRVRPAAVIGPADYHRCRAATAAVPDLPPAAATAGDVLQLTSGSTGEPKLARVPYRNLVHGGHTYRRLFGLDRSDVVLVPVPLAHSFGLVGGLFAALTAGAGLWTLGRFSLRHLLSALDGGATALLGTPMLYRLLAPVLPGRPRRLRVALSSGSPLERTGAAEIHRGLGFPVRQIYGSTETGLIAYQPESSTPWPDGVVGVAAPGVRLRIEPDPQLSRGVGHLMVRTPTMCRGAGHYHHTGDVASIDGQGRIRLVGRKDTFVNVGGRKVNPRRVERIIADHPAVREVFVYGATDDGAEERLHAAVVLDAGTGPEDIIAYCRARRLRPYEVPHHLHPLPRLPRNAMGKVDRRALPPTRAETT